MCAGFISGESIRLIVHWVPRSIIQDIKQYLYLKIFTLIVTIVSLIDQFLNIDILTYNDYKFFSYLFESNAKGDILSVQVASKKFKSRLKIFDELSRTNRKYLAIKAVFDRIPEDSKFIVVPEKIDDSILLCHLRNEVDKLNSKEDTTSNLDKKISQIASLYYTQSFNGNAKWR